MTMKYIYIQSSMSFAKRKEVQPRKSPLKYNLHRISFDDDTQSNRSDIPNIFLDQRSEMQLGSPMSPPKKKPQVKKVVQPVKNKTKESPKKRVFPAAMTIQLQQPQPQPQPSFQPYHQAQQPQIIQPQQPQIQPNTSLSLLQLLRLNIGEHLFHQTYPLPKSIYINNNNQRQNQLNTKEHRIKHQKEIYHYNNTLGVGSGFWLVMVLLRNVFGYLYIWLWVAVILLQMVMEGVVIKAAIQYGMSTTLHIVLLVIAVVVQSLADAFSIRKRRVWQQNQRPVRVYHHNGTMAQWVNIKANQIQPGHIYKISYGQTFPTDAVLLHAQRSILHIQQDNIISQLVQHPSHIMLKQTVIKGPTLALPFSGQLDYQIANPQYSQFQISGKLNLEEPNKVSHPVNMQNITLRGSVNAGSGDIICMALEVGIDSICLKNLQYPFSHRKQYDRSFPISKNKKISQQISSQIKQFQNTFQGAPLQSKFQTLIHIFFILYLLLSSIGVFMAFLYSVTVGNQFYLSQTTVAIWKIAVYHFTNHIIFIPVLLVPMYKLFIVMSGAIAQKNVSERCLEIVSQKQHAMQLQKMKRTSSVIVESQDRSDKNQLLDNKKIIFPVMLKDHYLLPQIGNIDTIVTTIDTFRDDSAFTLHSIQVKDLTHNFFTQNLDNQAYSLQDIDLIKYFMSVALLTTSPQPSPHYDTGIQLTAKRYLQLKKNKNAQGEIMVNNGQFRVTTLFQIQAVPEYPYKVVFLKPITEESAEQQLKVLVLVRGSPKTILDKTYGKETQLTQDARKLQQQKGYHVQLVAKTTLNLSDVQQISKAYHSDTIQKPFFYKNFQRYISKTQPMGLLIFCNQFYQKKIGEANRNPVLNKSMVNQTHIQRPLKYSSDYITSQQLPYTIILAPGSKSSTPQFQSIHTITNLLTNSYLFNYSLGQVVDKIVHQKPNNIQKLIQKLEEEHVLVWDNWEQADISYTIDIIKRYGRKVLLYLEKDQYMFLMKQAHLSVKGGNKGYDLAKYSDINITSRASISYLYLTQLIKYDSQAIRQALLCIFFTQIQKYLFYFFCSFINFFYTRATGLPLINSSLFLAIQITLFVDVFYYLNWKDSMRGQTFNKKEKIGTQILKRTIQTILQTGFTVLITIYTLQSPPDSSGTPSSYQYTNFVIVFAYTHILIFQKLFNHINLTFSVYRLIVLLIQLLVLYGIMIIVSLVDSYYYAGILWATMQGKTLMTVVGCVWACSTLPALRSLLQLMKKRNLRRGDRSKDAALI